MAKGISLSMIKIMITRQYLPILFYIGFYFTLKPTNILIDCRLGRCSGIQRLFHHRLVRCLTCAADLTILWTAVWRREDILKKGDKITATNWTCVN